MIIETGDLHLKDRNYKGQEPAAILELESEMFVRAGGAIRYDLVARRLNDDLLVRGSLAATMKFMCARCAVWFSKRVRVSDFIRSFPLSSEKESIDLTEDIREDILLALPINSVCSPECRGLCHVCGVNLNKQACACRPAAAPEAWSVLDRLKL